jgi:hypothetical protein
MPELCDGRRYQGIALKKIERAMPSRQRAISESLLPRLDQKPNIPLLLFFSLEGMFEPSK